MRFMVVNRHLGLAMRGWDVAWGDVGLDFGFYMAIWALIKIGFEGVSILFWSGWGHSWIKLAPSRGQTRGLGHLALSRFVKELPLSAHPSIFIVNLDFLDNFGTRPCSLPFLFSAHRANSRNSTFKSHLTVKSRWNYRVGVKWCFAFRGAVFEHLGRRFLFKQFIIYWLLNLFVGNIDVKIVL
jgi:hypothetical protein